SVGAERDRFAVLQPDQEVVPGGRFLERVEGAVVEDVAVLVDLDERRAAVVGRRPQYRLQVLAVGVDGTGDDRGGRPQRRRQRVERRVRRADRGRLGD